VGKKNNPYTANEQVTTMNYLKATICNNDLENEVTANTQHSNSLILLLLQPMFSGCWRFM